MRSDEIRPGDLVAGKYRVRAILSRSRGMLVEAFHTEFDQRVVIRILSPAMCDAKEIERFRREARTLAKLESEHVARIFDVGTESDGTFYFVRQYLEGQDLAAHLKKRGRLPLAEAVLYVLQAAEAMAETHSHQIILARDAAPASLLDAAPRRLARQGRRLRHGQAIARRGATRRRRRAHGHHDVRPLALLLAGARPQGEERRRPHRHLVARRDPLRAARRQAPVPRRDGRADARHHEGRPRPHHAAAPRSPARARPDHRLVPREGRRRPLRERARLRARARPVRPSGGSGPRHADRRDGRCRQGAASAFRAARASHRRVRDRAQRPPRPSKRPRQPRVVLLRAPPPASPPPRSRTCRQRHPAPRRSTSSTTTKRTSASPPR